MAKICKTCKEIKEIHNFVKDKQRLSGYGSKCKLCHANYNKKYVIARRKANKKPKEKIVVDKKHCYSCLIEKNIYEFTKCHSSLDGHRGKCRSCESDDRYKRTKVRVNHHYHKADLYCFSCEIIKPILDFGFTGLRQKEPKCKACINKFSKERRASVSHKLKISQKEFDDLLKFQNNVCAICENPETTIRAGKLTNLSIDHCHKTGKIRGLLCNTCNRGIGFMRDSSCILKKAAKYLDEHA